MARDYAATRPGLLYSTAGVHPHHAKEGDAKTIEALRALAASPEVVAIGECGLDFNRNFSPPAEQERWFAAQLELAVELKMPVFMHERDARPKFLELVRAHPIPRGVVHCFTGSAEDLDAYLSSGLFIGITGWICDERRGKHLLELVKKIPLDRLMLETDAPFLYPRNLPPRADRRNEPAFLPAVLQVVAGAYGLEPEEVAAKTAETTRSFFSLVDL